MRSNKVWDEETAGLPGLVENNNGTEMKEKGFELTTDTKTDGDARVGSLAAAEAVQAATDQRRSKEVTKIKKDIDLVL